MEPVGWREFKLMRVDNSVLELVVNSKKCEKGTSEECEENVRRLDSRRLVTSESMRMCESWRSVRARVQL